jgi:hypothetical protein
METLSLVLWKLFQVHSHSNCKMVTMSMYTGVLHQLTHPLFNSTIKDAHLQFATITCITTALSLTFHDCNCCEYVNEPSTSARTTKVHMLNWIPEGNVDKCAQITDMCAQLVKRIVVQFVDHENSLVCRNDSHLQ